MAAAASKDFTSSKPSTYEHLAAGIFAGTISTLAFYPLELVKTRMQVVDSALSPYRSFGMAFKTVLATESIKGFYKGAVPAILASAGSWGGYFFLYENAKARKLAKISPVGPLTTLDHLSSALEAGIILVLLFNPLWLVKTRLALQEGPSPSNTLRHRQYSGLTDALATIVREEGVSGLYKGLVPALLLTSHGAIQFAVYEKMKVFAVGPSSNGEQVAVPAGVSALAGALSKIVASTATYPYQVIKSRLQQRGGITSTVSSSASEAEVVTMRGGGGGGASPSDVKYAGTMDCIVKIWKQEGVRGFFRGVMPNTIKVLPAAGLTFIAYEEAMKALAHHHAPPLAGR